MKTNDVAGVECPLCSFSTHKIGISSRDGLERMAHALQTELPKDLDKNLHESEVLHCDSCGFEFAYPMRDPDALFYKWLTDYGFPYPARRWEWEACANLLEKKAKEGFSTPLTVLDFGSGDGKFLRRLKSIPGVYVVGMDHNPDMIQKCRDMGLDVIESNLNIETFKQKFSQGVYMATF